MDPATFRWVLIVIAIVLVAAIYLYGVHQSRLRKRIVIDTFTRDEVDSAFIEDEQLREELNNLDNMLAKNDILGDLDKIQINPAMEVESTPFALPDPELFFPEAVAALGEDKIIRYLLRHENFRLLTAEEIETLIQHTGLTINTAGFLEYALGSGTAFQVASLSAPGDFSEADKLNFSTLGLTCFIDIENTESPLQAYEILLKKIDEMVRLLNVKVYQSSDELLTISDVTRVRKELAAS